MLTDKQLEFALGEIQGIQKKVLGAGVGITISTECCTTEFDVTVIYGLEVFEDCCRKYNEKTFEFKKSLTEDQCVDYLQDIESLLKK